MDKKKRLLVFWSGCDFEGICKNGFLNHPGYEIELVASNGTPAQQATHRRILSLAKRAAANEFDLIIANNIMRSPYPRNKGVATTLGLALRFLTYECRRLDSWWAPWVAARATQTPLVTIDARDSYYIFPWDWPLLKASRLYFKREMPSWRMRATQPLQNYFTEKRVAPHIHKLRPLSQGVDESRFAPSARPVRERDIDLFISGSENPMRKYIREKAEKLNGRFKVFVAKGLLPIEEYHELMQRSKLAVCVESWGAETWRQYEVASAGCVPLINWPHTQVHEPLEPERHAFYFSYIGDHFERVVENALSDLDRLQTISSAGREFVLEKKGRLNLVDYVMKTTFEDLQHPGIGAQGYKE